MKTFFAVLLLTGSIATAADIKAERDAVLRKGKSTISPVVAPVQKGQVLPIVSRDGKWIQSDSQGQRGWAHESWLKEEGGNFLASLSGAGVAVSGGAQASAATDAAAAKGLGPTARRFAATKGLRSVQLEKLMKLRADVIDSGEFERFAREGKVGPVDMRG